MIDHFYLLSDLIVLGRKFEENFVEKIQYLECPHKYVHLNYHQLVVVVEVRIEFDFLNHIPNKEKRNVYNIIL